MKTLTKTFCALLAAFFAATSVAACSNANGRQTINLTRFNTAVHIEVYDKDIDDDEKKEITTLLTDLENELSVSKSDSKVSTFNNGKANETTVFSDTAITLIKLAKEYYTKTGGKFNFAVYPLAELWGFSSGVYPVKNFAPPAKEKIEDAKKLADPNQIIVDGNAVSKMTDGIKIDFGGLAKGYAAERVAEILKNNGHTNGYVNIGGSSLYILSLQDGSNTLGIRHPRNANKNIITLTKAQTVNTAVSTSGDYERYYEYDSDRYSHIIDGKSGSPANTGIVSATILGGDACFTDALTTALCLTEHTPNDTKNSPLTNFINEILSDNPNLKFFVFYEKGEVKQLVTNKRQGEDFTLLDKNYTVVKI